MYHTTCFSRMLWISLSPEAIPTWAQLRKQRIGSRKVCRIPWFLPVDVGFLTVFTSRYGGFQWFRWYDFSRKPIHWNWNCLGSFFSKRWRIPCHPISTLQDDCTNQECLEKRIDCTCSLWLWWLNHGDSLAWHGLPQVWNSGLITETPQRCLHPWSFNS